jgi:cell division protein FtsW
MGLNFFSFLGRYQEKRRVRVPINIDLVLVLIIFSLISIGFVMVASASMVYAEYNYHNPYYFIIRQGLFCILSIAAIFVALFIPIDNYEKMGSFWLLLAIILLVAVLIPGVGKVVNGSRRWIPVVFINLQVSEVVKLCGLMYFSGYLVRYGEYARTAFWGVIKPIALLCILALLLLMEPDFGATVVLFTVILGVMFLSGVRLRWFIILLVLGGLAATALIIQSPYRLARFTGFLDPWVNQYGSGYQLTQSLIAFGRGHWFGLGFGESIQKLFYLPEAHTDFIIAIISEEFGAIGVIVLLSLYIFLVVRGLKIAITASKLNRLFESYVAYGIVFWISFQVVVNIGVNTGLLPTKGLTLPLISYGGSSLMVICFALGILLRIDFENKLIIDRDKPKFIRKF